ncbi:MAG: non-homologous end-joining DNA ligase [Candidatus Atabeyarchaeum deiterrae]
MTNRLTKAEFTNLGKIMYPEAKITKAQTIEYYIRMAPAMLDLLHDRPLVLTRFPNGINRESFYEKDAPLGAPSWIKTFRKYSEAAERDINYVLCNDLDTLIWLANLAALEIHVTLSKATSLENPDLLLFDLDPQPPASFDDVVSVALLLKETLEELGLKSFTKTSGKRGLHIVVPIVSEYSYRQTREFVHLIGKHLVRRSEIVVSEFSREKKPGTIYIDYLQNSHGRTMVSPYSLRATPEATVSTPIDWKDVKKGLKPETLNLFTVPNINERPWEGMLRDSQRLDVD